MSLVRMHFCTLAARVYSSFTVPRNWGLKGTMPATVKSRLGSSGIREAEGRMVWPLDLKKPRKDWRISEDLMSPFHRADHLPHCLFHADHRGPRHDVMADVQILHLGKLRHRPHVFIGQAMPGVEAQAQGRG